MANSSFTFTPKVAYEEAIRCLCCENPPCMKGCPASIPVGDFVRRMRWQDWAGAAQLILEANPFGSVCGFVCPEENLCEKNCIRQNIDQPVSIRELQKFATWQYGTKIQFDKDEQVKGKVAVLGGGPAGLTCTAALAQKGVSVDLFDKSAMLGGVPFHTLPAFRLLDRAIKLDIQRVLKLGVSVIKKDVFSLTNEDLKEYDALFVGLGLGDGYQLNIDGEELENVLSAEEFLVNVKTGKCSEPFANIVVVGGGNTAMDCALSAKKMWTASNVTLSYRRRFEEMPAWEKEKMYSLAEGVSFMCQTVPVQIMGGGKAQTLMLQRTKPGEPDASGRSKPLPVDNSNFSIPADLVIKAVGQQGPVAIQNVIPGLELSRSGLLQIDESGKTSVDRVYAGGDCINGGDTVVQAVADGKKAAAAIIEKLQGGTQS